MQRKIIYRGNVTLVEEQSRLDSCCNQHDYTVEVTQFVHILQVVGLEI